MLKRLLWTIVALVLVAAIAFGAYCLYQKMTGGEMPFTTDSVTTTSQTTSSTAPNATKQPVVNQVVATEAPKATEVPVTEAPKVTEVPATEAPKATEVPATEAPKVTEAPATEAPKATEVPATEAPKVTEVPATEAPKVTEAPKQQPVLVTEAPAEEVVVEETNTEEESNTEVVVEKPNTKVNLLVDGNGKIFAITEKRREKVEKTVEVDETATKLQLQNGRLKSSSEAWRSKEEYVIGDVIEYDVKLADVFTTVEEALAQTKMKDENGVAHRLFDESKSGKLIVKIKFKFNNKNYLIEVWLQDELFTLRKLGEAKENPPEETVTSTPTPPGPSHNPDPTPTPPAPSHNPDPTPTPPAPSHNPDSTPTPSHNPDVTPAPSHNPDNDNSNTGNPNHNNDGNTTTQSTPTPPPVNENGDTLVEPGLVLPPK